MNTAVPVQFKVQRTNTIVVVILLKTTKQKDDKKKVRTMMMHAHSPAQSSSSLLVTLYIYTTCYMQMLGYRQPSTACAHPS